MALGLPSISIKFIQEGITAISRGSRGIVAMIIKEEKAISPATIVDVTDIPSDVTDNNKQLITNALIGNTSAPLRLELYIISGELTLQNALSHFENTQFDYLCYPSAVDEDKTAIVTWVKSQRNLGNMVKAVLANETADYEGIINVTQSGVVVGEKTYTAAEFTARVAGLIAGTDLRMSTTYTSVPEVDLIPYESRTETTEKVGKGEFILYKESGRIKVARGVNSLTTVSDTTVTDIQSKGDLFQKIKTVDIMDLIANDIRKTARDAYIGKLSNSYDNKVLLITAIHGYFDGLINDGLVEKNTVTVDIDMEEQKKYLKSNGVSISTMSDQQIREANTGDQVFIAVECKFLMRSKALAFAASSDAIEIKNQMLCIIFP